jgi:large subunit ribosomal protein L15
MSTAEQRADTADAGTGARKVRPIKIHHLRPAPGAKTPKTRVGRGEGGKGKSAGRGTKGTKARKQVPAAFEGGQMPIHMRLPKLKGFRNRFKVTFQVVNLERLAELFPNGGAIGPAELVGAGAVRKNQPIKVLGDGDLGGVKLQVSAHAFSAKAVEKIQAAGGSVTEL